MFAMTSLKFGFDVKQLLKNGDRVKSEDLEVLKKWIKSENVPLVINDNSDELFSTFLIACDGNVENAKICAKEYFLGRNRSPEVFSKRNISDPEIIKQFDTLLFAVSTSRTDNNEAIIHMTIKEGDYWRYNNADAMKLFFMTVDSAIYSNPPNGLNLIIDTKNLGLAHIVKTDLSITKRMLTYLYSGMNAKLTQVNILNVNWITRKFIGLLKPFISSEIFSLLKLHPSGSDVSTFFEDRIPQKCLPREYGGKDKNLEELNKDLWTKFNTEEMKNFFEQEEFLRNLSL